MEFGTMHIGKELSYEFNTPLLSQANDVVQGMENRDYASHFVYLSLHILSKYLFLKANTMVRR